MLCGFFLARVPILEDSISALKLEIVQTTFESSLPPVRIEGLWFHRDVGATGPSTRLGTLSVSKCRSPLRDQCFAYFGSVWQNLILRANLWLPRNLTEPVFVAQEQGLFKKYGLGVKELILLRGTGPAAAQMLVAGTAPIAALGGALVEAAIHGGGLVYIASTSNNLIFSLYSRSEIGRPEDLKGKTIAVDARGGSIELATIVAL